MIDVTIIGAGFAGAATAHALSRQGGLQIRLVEREATFGCHASGSNAAMLRQGVGDPQVAKWIQVTRRFLKARSKDPGKHPLLTQTGSFLLGAPQRLEPLLQQILTSGSKAQIFPPGQYPESCPSLLQEILQGGPPRHLLFCPGDGVIRIHEFLELLLHQAQDSGVELHYESPVTGLKPHGPAWEIQVPQGTWPSRVVVNAAGAWAADVGESAGMNGTGLIPHRRHLYEVQGLPPTSQAWPLVWDLDDEVYFRSLGEHWLLCPGDEEPQGAGSPQVVPSMTQVLVDKMERSFPLWPAFEPMRSWACLRTKTPNNKMYVMQSIENKGFFWAAGLGGHGVGASMGLGRHLAEQILTHLNSEQ